VKLVVPALALLARLIVSPVESYAGDKAINVQIYDDTDKKPLPEEGRALGSG
jgi:hypothetical protein